MIKVSLWARKSVIPSTGLPLPLDLIFFYEFKSSRSSLYLIFSLALTIPPAHSPTLHSLPSTLSYSPPLFSSLWLTVARALSLDGARDAGAQATNTAR